MASFNDFYLRAFALTGTGAGPVTNSLLIDLSRSRSTLPTRSLGQFYLFPGFTNRERKQTIIQLLYRLSFCILAAVKTMCVKLQAATAALLLCLVATAQTGGVSGTIRDSSGGLLPKATVSLIDLDTNATQTQTTGDSGNFAFPQVKPGRYRIEAEAAGFKKFVQSDISVNVQQQVSLNPVMQIGQATESIEVTAETPLLQPNTSSLGQVVNNRQISDLPLIGRNTLSLIGLTAGTQPIGPFGGIPARTNAYNQGYFSTSGSQVVSNETLI